MLTIVDYGMGNLRSVHNAVTHLGQEAKISSDQREIAASDKLILPGVGSFRRAMENIRNRRLQEALSEAVLGRKIPVLGICLGMQLMASYGYEDGGVDGLGWVPGEVVQFEFENPTIRIPHIGFNNVWAASPSTALLGNQREPTDFYFVHSYHLRCVEPKDVSAWCDYHGHFVAGIERGNVFGTQFHPEKSQANGLRVLSRFLQV